MATLPEYDTSSFPSIAKAKAFLYKEGYRVRMEASKLPVKFERPGGPTLTIASDDGGKTYVPVPYPSDKEIFKLLSP